MEEDGYGGEGGEGEEGSEADAHEQLDNVYADLGLESSQHFRFSMSDLGALGTKPISDQLDEKRLRLRDGS